MNMKDLFIPIEKNIRAIGLVYTPRIEDLRPRLRIQAPKRRNPAIKRYLGETSGLKKHKNIKH